MVPVRRRQSRLSWRAAARTIVYVTVMLTGLVIGRDASPVVGRTRLSVALSIAGHFVSPDRVPVFASA